MYDEILAKLTLTEKCRLINGVGSWYTYDCNKKIPWIMMTDGPHGLCKQEQDSFTKMERARSATCFPTTAAIANTWNTEAVAKLAQAIGEEAIEQGIDMVLGCGINIKRSPLCGRNADYFSEDPYLTGKMACTYIKGVQELGVGTSLKHFAGNNQEKRRQTSNSEIDERALREIYLSAFENVIKEAKPLTVMTSYNRLNDEYACADKALLTGILRDEWGFEGTVISDWGAVVDIVKSVKAGLDLEMPDSGDRHTKKMLEAIENGEISEAELDRAVKSVLHLVMTLSKNKELRGIKQNSNELYKEHHKLALELAEESAVLLKNDGILPLKTGKDIVVIGELAEKTRYQGDGSSHVTTDSVCSILEGLREKKFNVSYGQGYHIQKDKEDKKLVREAIELAKTGETIVFVAGILESMEGEGYDRKNLELPQNQIDLLGLLTMYNADVILVLVGGSAIRIPFKNEVNAILNMYLGGEAVGEALANLLTGETNPSGKLAETYPEDINEVLPYHYTNQNRDDIEYRESIFVGYRYYDSYTVPVAYEFGFGLSYTEFRYIDMRVSETNYSSGELTVEVDIKNVGTRAGSEIVEVYIANPDCSFLRPKRELRGFAKVYLEKNETKTVTITLDERSFSIYDVDKKAFIIVSGNYTIQASASLSDVRLECGIVVEGETPIRKEIDNLSSYFGPDLKNVTEEQFRLLYGKSLSNYDKIERGAYSLRNSFADVCSQSLLGWITMPIICFLYRKANIKYKKGFTMQQRLQKELMDGPLESLLCTGGGMIPERLSDSLVLAANREHWSAFKRLLHK